MSIDAIEYGVQSELRVTKWYRVRTDDSPSGYIEISKTPPTGANAMTVTIKPLYGEPFTINADLLRSAVQMAVRDVPQKFEEHVRRENWRRTQIDRLSEGDRVEIDDRGRCNSRRLGAVVYVDEYYAHLRLDREHEEQQEAHLMRKVPRHEIARVVQQGPSDQINQSEKT